MREPPPDVDDADVLTTIRRHWAPEADAVEHLPVGFGAHHWAASVGGRRTHFVTLDALGERHSSVSLEAGYAAAAALAPELEFVLASLVSRAGQYTAAFGTGALSVTPWVDGSSPERLDLAATSVLLTRLHAASAPVGVPAWDTLVPPSLADDLTDLARPTWDQGPYGERARRALRGRLAAVAEWADAYHTLADVARRRTWVLTHGEPHERNQVVAGSHTWLVDWESIRLAPAERDWRTLLERGWAPHPDIDRAMLELFDLEWRLDEISQYAAWFAATHTGTASDRVAMGGLLHELTR